MENIVIRDRVDFRCWVKTELLKQNTSQRALANKMRVPETRISEALHGKPTGMKYIAPLIEELGGNVDDFKAIM